MANIRELTESERQVWNEFVGDNLYGDTLQSWEWGQVKSTDGGAWRPIRLGAFNGKGELIGGMSILARSFPVVGTLYYAPRGPILTDWSPSSGGALLRDLIAAVRERGKRDGAMALKIDPAIPSSEPDKLKLLTDLGFSRPTGQDAQGFGGTQPKAVMIMQVDGRTDDELLMSFKPQCRRNVRIAEKKGVEVISECTREQLQPFFDLYKTTAERDGFTGRPLSYFENLWDNLAENGLAKLFLTRYESQYLSGAMCFVIGDKAVYVYGASSNENRNVMPNYAMQWAMIRWARDLGCKTYDFRGVAPIKPGEEATPEAEHLQGLNRFKEGFGAEFVEYVGEFDLPLNPAKYWLWTKGKPMAQQAIRKVRARR